MLKTFQRWLSRLLAVFRKPDAPHERVEPPALEPLTTSGVSTPNGRHEVQSPASQQANVLAAGLTPPPDQQAEAALAATGNRHERRAQRARARGWERERRKRDVFVTPQGPTPRSIPRAPRKEVVSPPVKVQGDGNFLMDGEDGYVYPERELYGEFAFRDTILDQLDRYWVYLRRMQKNDPESYGFYRQVGATIVPMVSWFLHNGVRDKTKDKDKDDTPIKLSAWWHEHRPTFGCITYGISSKLEQEELGKKYPGEPDTRMWLPKFLYFTKWKNPPPTVQMCSGGDIYSMVVWWDRPHDPKVAKKLKGGVPHEYAVFISRDGEDVHVLPMCRTEYIEAASRKNGLRKFDIPQRRWSIPKEFTEWAAYHGCDPNTFLSGLFINAANTYEHTHYSMIRVAVAKDDMVATFSVDVKRVPYFFQDRDVTLTQSGVKQPVFHIVRPHQRRTGAMVRMHFRGLKEFEWAGYRVKITVPGRDHFMLQDIDVGMMDEFWATPETKDNMTNPEFGTWIAKHLEEGTGATHPKPKER